MGNQEAKAIALEGLTALLGDEGDMGQMEDALPGMSAFLAEFAAPEFVCAMVPLPPTPEVTYPGVEGLTRAWRDWGETFESVRAELDEILESDTHLVLLVRQVAVTRHDRVEVTQPSAMVVAFSNGRVVRLEFHLDRDAALRSAGLRPQ